MSWIPTVANVFVLQFMQIWMFVESITWKLCVWSSRWCSHSEATFKAFVASRQISKCQLTLSQLTPFLFVLYLVVPEICHLYILLLFFHRGPRSRAYSLRQNHRFASQVFWKSSTAVAWWETFYRCKEMTSFFIQDLRLTCLGKDLLQKKDQVEVTWSAPFIFSVMQRLVKQKLTWD